MDMQKPSATQLACGSATADDGTAGVERVVSPRVAREILDVGQTRLYELLNGGELLSYSEGRSRKIILSSIGEYQRRRIEAESRAT